MTTKFDVANRALAISGERSQLTDFTSTPQGKYCGLLFDPFVEYMLREGDYDFSIDREPANQLSADIEPWQFTYEHPEDALRIRGVTPVVFNKFDPTPIAFSVVGFGGDHKRVVTDQQIGYLIITRRILDPTYWDAIFCDAYTRFLASGLIFALSNRIEASNVSMQQALQFAVMGAMKDG